MPSEELEQEIHNSMNRLRGRLAGAIEAMGLDERQERSAISLLKSITYDQEAVLVNLLEDNQDFLHINIRYGFKTMHSQ